MKAEDQDDDEYAICPYCRHRHYVESESQNPSGKVWRCDECKINFHYVTNYSVSHLTSGDCELNNLAHQWIDFDRHTKICEVCDTFRMKEESK